MSDTPTPAQTSTSEEAATADAAIWEPPGPGSWLHDGSHSSPSPSPVYRRIVSEHTEPVYRRVMARYGGALGSLDMQFVNGALYRRLVPLIAPDRDNGKVPPAPVLWLATRLHPEFRRREKTATKVLEEKSFLEDIKHWQSTERFEWIDGNRELEAVGVTELDDAALAEHLRVLDRRLVKGWYRHHELHGNDLGPIGDLLAHTNRWGIDPVAVMGLLRGSSPATTDAARHGHQIATALEAAGVDPTAIGSVPEIRAVGPASEALDVYLDTFGWRLISDYDIEGLTLHELPEAVVAIVRAAAIAASETAQTEVAENAEASIQAAEAHLRAQAKDRALFDELLDSARSAYGVRDDNGPLTWAWPAGLTRRAYLEAGARLADPRRAGGAKIDEASHVFELDIDELAALLDGATEPNAAELVARAKHRAWERTLDPPQILGPPAAEPDVAPLPPAMRRMMEIVLTAVTMLDPEAPTHEPSAPARQGADRPLTGLGVGSGTYRGTARVADDPARAIAAMAPGDVLVTPWTAPSFNAVLAIAGAVVVQEGGLLCHAAVMARELGIPAVVGCAGAMNAVNDGDLLEVDAGSNEVRIVQPAHA